MDLKSWILSLPTVVQYAAIFAIVMVILYVCLTLTRILGSRYGEKVSYDNPDEYEKTVPDLFASTAFKRKAKEDDKEKRDQ